MLWSRFCRAQVAVLIPILIWQLVTLRSSRHVVSWFIGGLFTSVAVVMSAHDSTCPVTCARPASCRGLY
jgi:hypothetical protein